MKDAKSLINALRRKNNTMSAHIRNKPDKLKIKFKSFLFSWIGWFGGGGPYIFQKKPK